MNKREIAQRDLQHAISLGIGLLNDLDRAMAQVRIMDSDADGSTIVAPAECLLLNRAVETAFASCCRVSKNGRCRDW